MKLANALCLFIDYAAPIILSEPERPSPALPPPPPSDDEPQQLTLVLQ
jgi:hypothetical protein